MNKLITMCFAVFLVIGLLGVVVAENSTDNAIDLNENESALELPEPGTDTAIENSWDKLRLAFTFNKEKKIQKALDIAEERLAEAKANAKENPERAEIARQRYEHFAQKAEDTLTELEEVQNGDNATESFGEIARIQNRFEVHRERAVLAHNKALEEMSKSNMSEEQLQKIEGIFQRFENNSIGMQQKMQQKRENLETKFKVRNEMTDKEISDFMEKVNKSQGLEKAREKRTERREILEQKREQIKEIAEERINNKISQANEKETDSKEETVQKDLTNEQEDTENTNPIKNKGI
ncbi:MAG: DUF5667 domain-containing protein [Nanoarchaeota archaeon]